MDYGNANNPGLNNGNARFCPPLSTMRIQVSGQDYPSADGLNTADMLMLQSYTEQIENVTTNTSYEKYASY
jgi:hypothetical protein